MVHFMHPFSPWQNTRVNLLCPFGLTKTLDFILRFLAMAMTEQAHHCSSGLTKTFTCVQLSNTYLSATLTTATFPTAAACRGFDACACTPRDLLSSHWQLRLHLMEGRQPFIYSCAPRGTRTGSADPPNQTATICKNRNKAS